MYIKVVSPGSSVDDFKTSSFAKAPWLVKYVPGEWAEPREGTKLFIYEVADNTPIDIIKRCCAEAAVASKEIWECEVEDVRLLPFDRRYTLYTTQWHKYWDFSVLHHELPYRASPYVRLASRVKLVRRIECTKS